MQRQKVLNVRLPDELLDLLDALVLRGAFTSRSEAIRAFTREYVLEQEAVP